MIGSALSWVSAHDLPARLFAGLSPLSFAGYICTSSAVEARPPFASCPRCSRLSIARLM